MTSVFRKRPLAAPQTAAAEAACLPRLRLAAWARRLEEALRMAQLPGARRDRLWARIRASASLALPGVPLPDAFAAPVAAALLAAARRDLERMDTEARRARVSAWRQRLRDDWDGRRRAVFAWIRPASAPPPGLLRRADGSYTGNLADAFELVHEAWAPIVQRFADAPGPAWADFASSFGHLVPSAPMELPPLSADLLAAAIADLPLASAPGDDGWRPAELRELPQWALQELSEVLSLIERVGRWPETLMSATTCLIPKAEPSADPLQQRPLTVMSAVYRAWAKARCSEILVWQERWLDPGQAGFRAGHGTADVLLPHAAAFEAASATGAPLWGASLDLSKAFDMVPHTLLFPLLVEMGMPLTFANLMADMYCRLRRRWRLPGGWCSREWHATNGLLQGCPLSVVLLNAVTVLWHRRLASLPAQAFSYADDLTVLAGTGPALQRALDAGVQVLRAFAMELSPRKCAYYANAAAAPSAGPALAVLGHQLARVSRPELLGAAVHLAATATASLPVARAADVQAPLARIRMAPLSADGRATLAATCALPALCARTSASALPLRNVAALRGSVLTAVLDTSARFRCAEVAFAGLWRGHLLDPGWAPDYAYMRDFVRVWARSSALRTAAAVSWGERAAGGTLRGAGPVATVAAIAARLGWSWPQLDVLQDPSGLLHVLADVAVPGAARASFLHELRESYRRQALSAAAARRADMQGVGAGLEAEVCRASLRRLAPYPRGCLRRILLGAVATADRLARAHRLPLEAGLCPRCRLAADTPPHRWWHCPAWEPLRLAVRPHLPPEDAAPACWWHCGLVPAGRADLAAIAPAVHSMLASILAGCAADDMRRSGGRRRPALAAAGPLA